MGIFNDLKLKINLGFQFLPCLKLSNGLPKYDQTYISLLFYIFLSYFHFQAMFRTFYISIILLINILLRVLICLRGCLAILSGDVEGNLGSKNNLNECLSNCH